MEKERERIERMLREGKITKEQSEELLKALEESTTREAKVIKKSKRKIIMISTAVIALVVIGGLLVGQELQSKIGGGKLSGQYYVHEKKGYKIAIPSKEWNPTSSRPLDIFFRNKKGGGWMGTGAYTMPKSFSFEEVNSWWIKIISTKYGWTDIKILEEKELNIVGFNAKLVTFEFTRSGRRNIDMTYHIWKPVGKYNLYRIRMTCRKDKLKEFLPVYKNFVNSFSFL